MRLIHIILLLGALFLSGCSLADDLTPPPAQATARAAQSLVHPTSPPAPTATTESSIFIAIERPNTEQGSKIYQEECVICHGERGLGDGAQASDLTNPPAPIGDLAFARKGRPVDWYTVVTEGKSDRGMPAFERLSDAERWDVVAYAFSLSSQSLEVLQGEEIFVKFCANCHGPNGIGSATAPALTDPQWAAQQSIDDLVSIVTEGIPPDMPPFSAMLPVDESVALAEYILNLSFVGMDISASDEEMVTEDDEVIESIVRGEVTNGSDGGEVLVAGEVTLYGFDDQQLAFTETAEVDELGQYQFLGVEILPGRLFISSLEHQGVMYVSEPVQSTDDVEVDLPITVFDTASDVSELQVDRMHVIVDLTAEDTLWITQLWIVSNLGDHTVADDLGNGIFAIQLPDGAGNLEFEGGTSSNRYQITSDGLIDLFPIHPGAEMHEIVFSFTLPFDKSLEFSQPIDYPVEAVVLLSPEGVVEIEGSDVEDMGLRQMTGASMRSYSAGPISPGEELEVSIKRVRRAGEVSGDSSSALEIVLGASILILALGGTGLWLYRRKPQKDMEETEVEYYEEPVVPSTDETTDRESIVHELADLDDAFEAGEIDDEAYQHQRDGLKQRLMDMMQANDD